MTIYINGILSATASASIPPAIRNSLWIGRNTCSNTYLAGKIHSLQIWDSALSSTQVSLTF